jgi:F-type H+-transporting ATPase subunit epsilon
MKLKVLLPSEIFLEEEANKIIAEAPNGYFCLLPRHIDFVTALIPGILFYEDRHGQEIFLAIDEAILTKVGSTVNVSTRNAARGPELGRLRRIVEEQFSEIDEREKKARTASAKIETTFIRRFLEIN